MKNNINRQERWDNKQIVDCLCDKTISWDLFQLSFFIRLKVQEGRRKIEPLINFMITEWEKGKEFAREEKKGKNCEKKQQTKKNVELNKWISLM